MKKISETSAMMLQTCNIFKLVNKVFIKWNNKDNVIYCLREYSNAKYIITNI